VLIDPVDLTVDRDVQLLQEMGLRCTTALNTHCHAGTPAAMTRRIAMKACLRQTKLRGLV
jgi:hypothetical protein